MAIGVMAEAENPGVAAEKVDLHGAIGGERTVDHDSEHASRLNRFLESQHELRSTFGCVDDAVGELRVQFLE